MKRLLSLLGAVLLAVPVFGQNTLTLHFKNGEEFSFGLDEKPVIEFTESELVVKTVKTELRYQYETVVNTIANITFDDKKTSVFNIGAEESKPGITLDEYTVRISGAKADATVSVIASDGKQLRSYKTDADGSVTFSIADLSQGIYIIKSENLTFKILKK